MLTLISRMNRWDRAAAAVLVASSAEAAIGGDWLVLGLSVAALAMLGLSAAHKGNVPPC